MGVLESLGKVLDFLSVKEWEPCLNFRVYAISRPYLSNGRAIGMVVIRRSVCLSVTDVLWLTGRA